MALFKAMAGANKTALDTQPLTQGYCWFTTEDGKFYIDALANQQDATSLTRFVLNAEKADKDGDGNVIKDTYLPLTGGTLTGILKTTSTIQFQKTISGTARYITLKTVGPTASGTTYNLNNYSFQISIPGFTSNGGSNSRTYVYRTPKISAAVGVSPAQTETYYLAGRSTGTTAGSKNVPVYCNASGVLYNCDTYAGGTAVTLNGTSKGASTASFYAPTTTGTVGQFLQSNGTEAPTWVDLDPGVKSISTGETNGTISVNTNGTTANVAVKGLQSNAYTSTGLTAVQTAAPTSAQYTLWVDTDEETAAAMPLNAPKYKTFSIGTGSWSGSGPYTYAITMNGVTASDAVIVLNVTTASAAYLKAQLDWETAANKVTLSTATKPTGTVAGYLITLPVTSV